MSPWDALAGQQMPPQMQMPQQMQYPRTAGLPRMQQLEQSIARSKSQMSDLSLQQAQLKWEKDRMNQRITLMQKLMGDMKSTM